MKTTDGEPKMKDIAVVLAIGVMLSGLVLAAAVWMAEAADEAPERAEAVPAFSDGRFYEPKK